jgi:hypothetical protein
LTKDSHDVKTVVLRKNLTDENTVDIVEQKKINIFKSFLTRPKKESIHIHSIKLCYECIMMISGKYVADYFKKATHTISVDSNVREIALKDGIFPIRTKSGFKKAVIGKRGKNKIDLKLEEHVFIEEEDQLTFDHHGREIKFPFKINSKTIENYPKVILKKNESNVKKSELTHDDLINKLQSYLKKPIESDVRDINDEFVLREITEIYVPIFEARLIGPKQKIGIMRIDAVRKKVL